MVTRPVLETFSPFLYALHHSNWPSRVLCIVNVTNSILSSFKNAPFSTVISCFVFVFVFLRISTPRARRFMYPRSVKLPQQVHLTENSWNVACPRNNAVTNKVNDVRASLFKPEREDFSKKTIFNVVMKFRHAIITI